MQRVQALSITFFRFTKFEVGKSWDFISICYLLDQIHNAKNGAKSSRNWKCVQSTRTPPPRALSKQLTYF